MKHQQLNHLIITGGLSKMDQRKMHIIEVAIALFSKKGFKSTSIQKIAEESGVSKGAVYLQFRSKDELLLEIFRYYSTRMREKVSEVEEGTLLPKENFTKQLQVQYEEVAKHKEFIIMQHREQALSTNKEVGKFLWSLKYEIHQWYERNLLNIYGDQIKPYIMDGGLLLDGISSSYLQMVVRNDVQIDFSELASFMMRRLDDLMQGMIQEKEKPLITKEMVEPIFINVKSLEESLQEEVEKYLSDMQEILSEISLENKQVDELQGALDLLKTEIQKPEPQKFIFQGMLTNFKGIEEFNMIRRLLADRLDIQLL